MLLNNKSILLTFSLACLTLTLYGQEVIDESEMNNKEIATNAIDAIKGRVAGMQVETTGNALSAVRLRGTTSLSGGNDPLVIIDGVMGNISMLESILPTHQEFQHPEGCLRNRPIRQSRSSRCHRGQHPARQ